MNNRLVMILVFTVGVSLGWFARALLPVTPASISSPLTDNTQTGLQTDSIATTAEESGSELSGSTSQLAQDSPFLAAQGTQTDSSSSTDNIIDRFDRLIRDRAYNDAIELYQQQEQQNPRTAIELKARLVRELRRLSDSRNNSDFSALTESYLSIYYDDIDVLLLLADFNQLNGSYLEVVDVYLLATTYAYSDADQRKVTTRFNQFVDEIDRSYTGQKNWWSLMNLYAHINTSGLMTSPLQYRQAIAHLRSGDTLFAAEQFNQLLNDSLVGESAALALSNLTNQTSRPADIDPPDLPQENSIPLQRVKNQYIVGLTNERQDAVNLLIDTGASMTALSSKAFDTLNASGEAVQQERRVFNTAGGVIMGTVYSLPQLRLGEYLLKDTRVAVIDFDTDRTFDGLLGMNVLGQFRFRIDQDNSRLILTEK